MFDNNVNNDTQISELVGGICRLASCLEDRANTTQREETLHETLRLTYKLEEALNQRDERIAYLERLAMTDSLTGLLNRRGFQAELQRVLASARRFNETGVLAYVDLDDFKRINDTFGHTCGDEVLCHVARVLERKTRGMDYVARLGGDEFAILLVRTQLQDGERCIEKISHEINTTTLRWQEHALDLKASFGIRPYDKNSSTTNLICGADDAMYLSKKLKQGKCTLNAAE